LGKEVLEKAAVATVKHQAKKESHGKFKKSKKYHKIQQAKRKKEVVEKKVMDTKANVKKQAEKAVMALAHKHETKALEQAVKRNERMMKEKQMTRIARESADKVVAMARRTARRTLERTHKAGEREVKAAEHPKESGRKKSERKHKHWMKKRKVVTENLQRTLAEVKLKSAVAKKTAKKAAQRKSVRLKASARNATRHAQDTIATWGKARMAVYRQRITRRIARRVEEKKGKKKAKEEAEATAEEIKGKKIKQLEAQMAHEKKVELHAVKAAKVAVRKASAAASKRKVTE